ncbi:MAG: hypothetical protein KKH68_14425 [Proteobacteria bacterium]|nr:hypothetical protein [Pseudomonadota bacterium]
MAEGEAESIDGSSHMQPTFPSEDPEMTAETLLIAEVSLIVEVLSDQ